MSNSKFTSTAELEFIPYKIRETADTGIFKVEYSFSVMQAWEFGN